MLRIEQDASAGRHKAGTEDKAGCMLSLLVSRKIRLERRRVFGKTGSQFGDGFFGSGRAAWLQGG